MNNEIRFENIRSKVRDDILAMTVEDPIDDFLRILQPKMEANVQRRRDREKNRKNRQNAAARKKGVTIFRYFRKKMPKHDFIPIFQGNLALGTYSKYQRDRIEDQPHLGEKLRKNEINRYLKRIGCNLRVL